MAAARPVGFIPSAIPNLKDLSTNSNANSVTSLGRDNPWRVFLHVSPPYHENPHRISV
jgi:hypothetical protein